ncbi:pyridoxal-dependent decarboxylase [Streptacidiphilus sp. ASG 303]|uniref:pyridoxal phosphate-dependent decarboxylase family protein n=1 Tax=Streptacidiphilus sp. ASG 303 TaxID=2896847 RepID=UPI001E43AAC0|nr:pyridoxal-dependent decarboxylase [Streptacidiphilus sp. ASG 303]MCD0481711.1 pyridoxal-dependent decarboxylase [Streptacidiphilus sp. ASG 303]
MSAAPHRMHQYDADLVDLVFDYMRGRLQYDPVPLDHPGDGDKLRAHLDGLLNERGNAPADVMKLYDEHLSRAVISADSPRYLSFIPCAPTKAALLFDMVVSCASLQGISWLEAAGAIAAENQVLRLIADRAGLPATAGGCFVSGGSAGNLSALVVARDTARRKHGVDARARLRIAVSDQAHSSITNTLNIIGVEALVVPTEGHRLTGEALRAAIEADDDRGSIIGVVATAGTTNAGIIDDLAGVADVAGHYDLWFHVDGAYGGAGLFAPSVRERYNGIERADSFVVDPHKWLFAPFDCAALIYRKPWLAKGVHTQDASYLDVLHTGDGEEWNPTDYAYHLTRRARGLPLWFSLAVHGTQAYTDAIEEGLRLARETAQAIRDTEHLELVRDPELSAVVFRRKGWGAQDYYDWSQRLLAGQVGFVTPTGWEGETVARFAFLHPGTSMEMVHEILGTMA